VREASVSRIRVRFGDNEIELEGADDFIKRYLEQFYARAAGGHSISPKPAIREQLLSPAATARATAKAPTPAEFFRQKGKTDGVSQILVFGKYLEQYCGKPEFTPKDVNAVAKEAKLAKDVHPQYFSNAVKQGLLRKQGQYYSLTLSAEELLAAT
jgi:hypothetical protein